MTTNNNDPNITVDVDATYTFEISEKTIPNFKMAASISQWLVTNLSNLTDDHDKKIFNKVNTGFNESSVRTFGSEPVCDVYIDNVEYETDFDAGRKQERMPRELRNQLKGYTFVGTASSDFKIDNGHIWFAREVYIKGMKVKDKPK